jgi:hypothetical protein
MERRSTLAMSLKLYGMRNLGRIITNWILVGSSSYTFRYPVIEIIYIPVIGVGRFSLYIRRSRLKHLFHTISG